MHQWITWLVSSKTNCILYSAHSCFLPILWAKWPFGFLHPPLLFPHSFTPYPARIWWQNSISQVLTSCAKMSEYNILSGASCPYSFGQTLPLPGSGPADLNYFVSTLVWSVKIPLKENTLYTVFRFSFFKRKLIELSTWLKTSVGPLLPAE